MYKAFLLSTVYNDFQSLNTRQFGFLFIMILTILGLSSYWQDTAISTASGVTGVICVFMVNMRKLSNYFWGFINVVLYGYVAYTASYYGDTMLNWLFYLPIQFIGAYMWSKSMSEDNMTSKKITSIYVLIGMVVGSIITVLLYSHSLALMGGNLTTIDATTTTLSMLATFLMIKGYREQWVCWIMVNFLSIYMWSINFIDNETSFSVLIMWIMFLSNSVYGAYTWFNASND